METLSKNKDILLAPKDDCMLNDIYSVDQLPDFWFEGRPRVPRHAPTAHTKEPKEREEHEMNDNVPLAPAASSASEDLMQQLASYFDSFQKLFLDQQQELHDGQRRILTALVFSPAESSSQPPL